MLVYSCLILVTPCLGQSQDGLWSVHAVEKSMEMPAAGVLSNSFAGIHLRNDFCTKEMMMAEAAGQFVLQKNVLLASVNHYGYSGYGDLKLSFGYGRNFGDRFAMTARVFYLMAHARGYPTRHSLSVDFAFAYRTSPKLLFDAAIYNPFMLRYGVVGQEVIPMKFSVGCAYKPVRKFLLSLTMSKVLPGSWEVDFRFMTQPMDPLLLEAGCSNHRLGLYIGWKHKHLLLSVSAGWYYRISVSPEIGCFYFFDKVLERRQ